MKVFKLVISASATLAILASMAVADEIEKIGAKVSPLIDECMTPRQAGVSIQRLPIDECGGPIIIGPTRAPSVPPSITYAPYTNTDSIKVSWGTSIGYGYSVKYQVYESKDNGSWVSVYTGYGKSTLLSNKTEGKYRYRVKASNTKYSSSPRYGGYSIINPRQEENLYSKYPEVMYSMDQKNLQYRSSASSSQTSLRKAKAIGQSSNMQTTTGRFYLGDGIDLIRGTLKETCLNIGHSDFSITKTAPSQPSTFDISYVNDNRHLAELLEVSASAKVGFTGDDFSLGLSGEKDRYVSSVADENHVRFVVKVKNRREFWKLNTPTDAIYPELVGSVLLPNSNEAKADFRERCGDNFINSANLGSALYLVFTFDAKKYSYEERENAKAELGGKIGDFFSVNGTTGSSSSFKAVLDRHDVSINADQVGGPTGLAASITPSNVMEKYDQFVQNTSSANWAAVDYSTNNYQRPTIYNAYSHDEIFAKYTGNQGPLAQMRRWLDLSVQHKERCDPYGEYGQARPTECGTSEAEISIAMDLCRDTRQWDDCVHPYQYYTGSLTTTSPGTYLYGWLSDNIPKLYEDTNSQYYKNHKHTGSKTVDDRTCLASSQCFVNKFRGSGWGIGKGFSVHTSYYDNPKGGSRSHSLYNNYCARSQVYLKTGSRPFGDTTADWNYTVTVTGLCPSSEDFVVIP